MAIAIQNNVLFGPFLNGSVAKLNVATKTINA